MVKGHLYIHIKKYDMVIANFIKNKKFSILFIFFVVFYSLYYAPFGYDDADGGWTLALSWRIFNGEIPYRDILLVRPPLSPFFHMLPFYVVPDNYQVIFDRVFTYLLFALSSLFGALTLDKVFRLKDFKLNTYLLATIGFVFSVHNFPAMAWHTVDAVFFASIGIYILVCFSSIYSICFGILFLFLSALCKQPFYLMPFAGVIFVYFIHKSWKKSSTAIFSLSLFVGIFFLILYKHDLVTNFIDLTSGSTKLKDILNAGFIKYIQIDSIYILLPFGFWIIIRNFSELNILFRKVNLVPYFFISILLIYPIALFIKNIFYNGVIENAVGTAPAFFRDWTAKLLFIITIIFLIENKSREKKWFTLGFLTLVSWCASISWGYQTPVFFSMPLIFGFFLVSHQYFEVEKMTKLALYTLFIGTITYFIAYQSPYCNPLRAQLTYKIDDLFPKLKYIKVGRETHDKYTEFSLLINKYGNNFKTLPGMPLSNYLTNTNSPLKIDWVFNAETSNKNDEIIKDLILKKTIIFMEKKPLIISVTSDLNEKYNSSVSYIIKTNWMKIDSTTYFDIYRSK